MSDTKSKLDAPSAPNYPAATRESGAEFMSETTESGYQVLARKYRPETFADLVGQDAMVRTLKNAFAADRIAQAFIMTGIRGTGKTTTARIIAKGMNCIGPGGESGPTTDPCGLCEPCRAIMEGRHVDVLEMDAASRTGVGDIREIIDSVHYRAASARYKIYIIDEVHMLSTSAFNALLKTLEEPPEHVKFIFATTEIRKVPVTVLSRCQRFDLRRIEPEDMIARGRVLDLFTLIMQGDAAGALSELSSQYAEGADPMAVLRDLAEVTHWISVVKITPEAAEDPTIGPDERGRGQQMAAELPMRVLTRMWQMLLKALDEVAAAPNAMMAAEMAVIRLTHVAELPSPEELVRKLRDAPPPPGGGGGAGPGAGTGTQATATQATATSGPQMRGAPQGSGATTALAPKAESALADYPGFEHVVELIRERRDVRLLVELETCVRLVAYRPGRIEFVPTDNAPSDLAQRMGSALQRWTGHRWAVSLVNTGGGATIAETRDAAQRALEDEARAHPLVQAVFNAFPQARIEAIRTPEDQAASAMAEALPEVEDEWDPFEEE